MPSDEFFTETPPRFAVLEGRVMANVEAEDERLRVKVGDQEFECLWMAQTQLVEEEVQVMWPSQDDKALIIETEEDHWVVCWTRYA
jgi:hypothetical protein